MFTIYSYLCIVVNLSIEKDMERLTPQEENIMLHVWQIGECAIKDVHLSSCLTGTGIKLAGQNVYWAKEGAYTGEISAKMLKSAGCEYVIIGHSERRQIFGETDSDVNSKIRAQLRLAWHLYSV